MARGEGGLDWWREHRLPVHHHSAQNCASGNKLRWDKEQNEEEGKWIITVVFLSVEKGEGRVVLERCGRRGSVTAQEVLRESGDAEVWPGASPVTLRNRRGEKRFRDGSTTENCGNNGALTGHKEDDGAEGETEQERRGKQVELVWNLSIETKTGL